MTAKEIGAAWAKIRTIDNTIPDDVLDFMKEAAIEKLTGKNLTIERVSVMIIEAEWRAWNAAKTTSDSFYEWQKKRPKQNVN